MNGRQLSIDEALALCVYVGFPPRALVKAVSVMTAESQRYVAAIGINANLENDGTISKSIDRGLFQINSVYMELDNDDALTPIPNATKALSIWDAMGWSPWNAYTSGKFQAYVPDVQAARDSGFYVELAPYVECL